MFAAYTFVTSAKCWFSFLARRRGTQLIFLAVVVEDSIVVDGFTSTESGGKLDIQFLSVLGRRFFLFPFQAVLLEGKTYTLHEL